MTANKHEAPLRPRLLLGFLHGFYLVLPVAAALSTAIAVVGSKFGVAMFHRVPLSEGDLFNPLLGISILMVCLIFGAIGVIGAARAMVEFLKALSARPRILQVAALRVQRAEAPELWDSVVRVSRHLNIPAPDNLILEFGAQIFVTDSAVNTCDAALSGRTLCISAPLLRVLSVAELESLLAHEMAHFTGEDMILSQKFYPAYHAPVRAMQQVMEQASESRWRDLGYFFPKFMISSYLALFARVEKPISRIRELRADAIAAGMSGPEIAASALKKLHAYGSLYSVTYDWIVRWLKEGSAFVNVPLFFVDSAQRNPSALARSVRGSGPPHPFNGHPAYSERAAALGIRTPEPQVVVSGVVAAALLPGLERFEERLTELRTLEIMKARPGHLFTKRQQPPMERMSL